MTRTTQSRCAIAIAALLPGFAAGTAQAQETAQQSQAELDRTPTDCVLLNRVARNQGVNDHQIVFFMRGNTYYLNVLDAACQSAGETSLVFHYRTRSAKITRICDTDTFTVERQTSRIGCGLGKFTPITAEEAAALTGRPIPAATASSSGDDERSGGSSRRGNRD